MYKYTLKESKVIEVQIVKSNTVNVSVAMINTKRSSIISITSLYHGLHHVYYVHRISLSMTSNTIVAPV